MKSEKQKKKQDVKYYYVMMSSTWFSLLCRRETNRMNEDFKSMPTHITHLLLLCCGTQFIVVIVKSKNQ